MSDANDRWEILVKIHQMSKRLALVGEELGRDINPKGAFLQPLKEQRDVLEHIVRCQAALLGVGEAKDDVKAAKDFDKAIGHEYRAFFDQADFISVLLDKYLAKKIEPYSNYAITQVIPEYYKELKPQIWEINEKIAQIRYSKGISNSDLLPEVEQYRTIVEDLIKAKTTLIKKIPSLEEFRHKEKRERHKVTWRQIGVGVLIAVFSFAIAKYDSIVGFVKSLFLPPPSP